MSPVRTSQQSRRAFYGVFLGLIIGLVAAFAQYLGWLQKLEIIGLDYIYALRGEPPTIAAWFVKEGGAGSRLSIEYDFGKLSSESGRRAIRAEPVLHPGIRVIGIDQDTDRLDHANLVNILRRVGVKVVAFDVSFSKETEAGDVVADLKDDHAPTEAVELLRELLAKKTPAAEAVERLRQAGIDDTMAQALVVAIEEGRNYKTTKLAQAIERAGNVILPVFQSFKPAALDPTSLRRTTWPFVQAYSLERNRPEIGKGALAFGHINVDIDQGLAFGLPFGLVESTKERGKILQLGLLAGLAVREGPAVLDDRFAEEAAREFGEAGLVDPMGRVFPRLAAPPFVSIAQFFEWYHEHPEEIDVFFRDTLVFVGHTAKAGRITDQIPSPYGPWFGLFYHASAAYSVFTGKTAMAGFLRPRLSHGAFVLAAVLVSVVLGFVASRFKAWLAILVGLGVLGGYWGLCVAAAFGVFAAPALWPTACLTLTVAGDLLGVFVLRSGFAERLLLRREKEIAMLQIEDAESAERVDVRRVDRQIAGTVHGEAFGADWCVIREVIRTADGEEIRTEEYGAYDDGALKEVAQELSERVFREGQPLLVQNVQQEFPHCPASVCPSAMAVALKDGRKVIGSVVIGGKLRERFRGQPRYQLDDLAFMRALAREWSSRVVIAQYNRTLEDRVQARTLDLRMANDRLQELDRQKSDFMNMVAHDLRTPLTSIRSYAEIMLTYQDEPPETYNEFLSIINDESVRLNGLIDNFLDLARIEAGSFRLELEPTDLAGLIEHALAVFRGHAEPKAIALTAEVPEGLPKVLCDGDRIAQVLANLLSNALKFTPEGGRVAVRAEPFEASESPGEPMVKVSVTDTGPGVPEDARVQIFQKFGQVDTDDEEVKKTQRAGTGLGLPLCREFVEKHQGRIWVESEVGKGSRFHFTLFCEGSTVFEASEESEDVVQPAEELGPGG